MIRCAIAGYGWWGQNLVQRLIGTRRLDVRYVIEPDAERASSARHAGLTTRGSFRDALSDPAVDAVILATPDRMHVEQIRAAASAGKHVFCEKPLALTRPSAERAVAACQQAGVVLGVGHQRRFDLALAEVKRRIDSGALGAITYAESALSYGTLISVPRSYWRTGRDPAAVISEVSTDLTDLFIWMFGRVVTVAALESHRVLVSETGEVVTVHLRFEGGMTGTICAIRNAPPLLRCQVFGSGAWAEVRNFAHPDTPGGTAELLVQASTGEAERKVYEWADAVVGNLEAFADAVEGRAAYPYTGEEMIHNIAVLEAIAEAARTESVVQLGAGDSARCPGEKMSEEQVESWWQQWT